MVEKHLDSHNRREDDNRQNVSAAAAVPAFCGKPAAVEEEEFPAVVIKNKVGNLFKLALGNYLLDIVMTHLLNLFSKKLLIFLLLL